MKTALIMTLALVAAVARAENGITCIDFTLDQSRQNSQVWDAAKKARAKSIGLDSPTPQEWERQADRPLALHRLNHLLWAQRMNAMAATVAVNLPDPSPLIEAPFEAVGRLFVVDNLLEKSCTAFFVGDLSVVMTAAHCVFDPSAFDPATGEVGAFYSNIHYTRVWNVNGGGEDYSFDKIVVPDEWKAGGTPHDFDYAFMHTTTKLAAITAPLTATFGGTGTPANWIAIGYPDDTIYDGTRMMHASGTADTPVGNMLVMLGNPMGHGTSGGPWIPPGVAPYGTEIISVSSLQVTADILQGPILDKHAKELFENVRDKTGCK